MVCHRSLVISAIAALGLVVSLGADRSRGPGGLTPLTPPKSAEAKADERPPLASRPYTIKVWMTADPLTRLDAKAREELLRAWQGFVRRFVGTPWSVTLQEGSGPFAAGTLETLKAADLKPFGARVDKLWLIGASANPSGGLRFAGREFDVTTGDLGPLCEVLAPYPADAARRLLKLSLIMFRPFAEVGSAGAGDTSLTVQGADLNAADPIGAVAPVGSVFVPFRVFQRPNGVTTRLDLIRYSYLRIKSADGSTARCDIISSLRDPLSRRVVGRNKLIALGVKPSAVPTRFRFTTNEKLPKPIAGYTLTVRDVPDGPAREVGTTDREGRIVVPPGMAEGLVVFRLLAGNIEPLVEFPGMPGETAVERVLKVDPKAATVTLETKLNALKDQVIDLVAIRARLEARMKARAEGGAWDEVRSLLDEYKKLPPKIGFVEQVNKLRDDAMTQQQATKKAILTKTAQAQLADAEALVTQYLDDEMFTAYETAWKDSQEQKPTPAAPATAPATAAQPKPKAPTNPGLPESEPPRPAPAAAVKPAPAPIPAPAAKPGPTSPGIRGPGGAPPVPF
jgi:hypothetical protein